MTLTLDSSRYDNSLKLADTNQFDTLDDFTGNIKDLLNFVQTDANGTEIADGALSWVVQWAYLAFSESTGSVVVPSPNAPVADDTKMLGDGSYSTHRVNSDYGTFYYHAVSGAYAYVVDADALNALLTKPILPGFPAYNDKFYIPLYVTVETTDLQVAESETGVIYIEITDAADDELSVESVPLLFSEGNVGVFLRPETFVISDVDTYTSPENIFIEIGIPNLSGQIRRAGVGIGAGDSFTYQDVIDGLIEFVFYPGAAPESTTLPLYLTDLSGNDRQPVLLEIFQRQLLQPDEDIVGNNIVDLSDETEGKVIQTGDGHDTIIGSQGEDEIEAGRGDDFVDLGDSQSENGADEVIYRFDSSGQAVDGGDIIKNFHRGEDRFTFINVDSAAQTLQSFLRDAAGPDGIALTGDDLFTVSPALLRDEQGVVWVTGLLFRFKEGGTFDSGTRLAASQITLSFQSPMTTDGFFEAIGGITNFDAARLAVRDLTQITNLLGEQGLALETEGQTQLVVLEGTYAEGEPSLMVDLPEGQNTEVDTHVQLDVTETQSGRAPSVAWFTVYEDALRETISPHFGVVEDGNVFKLVLLAGNPLFLHEQGDMNNFDLFIVANDGVQDSALLQVHIQLKDVGLAPRDLTLDTLQVMEGRDGLVIGTLSAIDDDGDTDIQFSIATEGDYHLFEIVNGNQVKLVDDYQADYEMRNILEVSVTARDSVGLFVTEDFVVDVVNDASEAAAARYDDKGETYTYPGLELEDHIYQLFSGGGWAETLGQGLDLSFSFIDPDGSSLFVETYQQSGVQFDEHLVQMADVLKQSTRSTLELFEEVTLLNFVEVEEAETGTTGHLRFGLQNGKDTSQIVTFPGSRSSDTTHAWGDVWLNGTELGGLNQVPRFNNPPDLVDGSYFASTIMHETGHALGLYHPFQTSRITVTPYGDNQYRGSVDNIMSYTVMSYFNYVTEDTDTLPTFGLPTTLMINDIAALQYMYGVNEQTRRGDDLYTLASFNTTDQKFIHATIWDAAGEDTFSWADQTTKARISLVDGSHSFFGDIYNDGITDEDLNANLRDGSGVLGIAHGSDIENAIGGAASDLIVGNHLDNILFGGPLGGADTLIGGAGADVFVTSLATSNSAVTADKISDFSDGEDLIGLADITLDEVAWEDVTNGALDPRVRVYHSDSNFTLFYLDDVEIERVDASDFIQTDFV